MILAVAQDGGLGTVTVLTSVLLTAAAVVSALTPVALARRRTRREAATAAAEAVVSRSDLTLASWTALNEALQREIGRLQGVTAQMQSRIDLLERELATLKSRPAGYSPRA